MFQVLVLHDRRRETSAFENFVLRLLEIIQLIVAVVDADVGLRVLILQQLRRALLQNHRGFRGVQRSLHELMDRRQQDRRETYSEHEIQAPANSMPILLEVYRAFFFVQKRDVARSMLVILVLRRPVALNEIWRRLSHLVLGVPSERR